MTEYEMTMGIWTQAITVSTISVWVAVAGIPGAIAQSTPGICPADLSREVERVMNRPDLVRSRIGILVTTLPTQGSSPQVLYAHDAERFFLPASNVKLMTTAAALQRLGPDFRFQTSIYGTTQSNGLTVLRVMGGGDPSLTEADLAVLADDLVAQGIRRVSHLIADDHTFPGSSVNPTWEWEDLQAGYGAPVNSLMLNGNAVGLSLVPQGLGQPLQVVWDDPRQADQWQVQNQSITVAAGQSEWVTVGRSLSRAEVQVQGQLVVGSEPETAAIAIPNPGTYFLHSFQSLLQARGIAVGQATLTLTPAVDLPPELATHPSPTLADLIATTNRTSNNLYAEALLKSLGMAYDPEATDATTAGLEAMTITLTQLGVPADSYALADGSGLSRHNLASPAALVATLQAMAASPYADLYRQSLAIAGETGTLSNRFRGTPVEGRLYGKTGAISNNAALSGYLYPPNYSPLTISILVNHVDQPVRSFRTVIDEIVILLSRLQGC